MMRVLLKLGGVILIQGKNINKWNSRKSIWKLQLVCFREALEQGDWTNTDEIQHLATLVVGGNAVPVCLIT